MLINNQEVTWEEIFNYGEDYELIFTVNKENSKILKNHLQLLTIRLVLPLPLKLQMNITYYIK